MAPLKIILPHCALVVVAESAFCYKNWGGTVPHAAFPVIVRFVSTNCSTCLPKVVRILEFLKPFLKSLGWLFPSFNMSCMQTTLKWRFIRIQALLNQACLNRNNDLIGTHSVSQTTTKTIYKNVFTRNFLHIIMI